MNRHNATDGVGTPTHQALGEAIHRHRKAAGMSQEDLEARAARPSVSQGQISNWERAVRSVPTIDDLYAIEMALELRPGTLLADAGYVQLPTTMLHQIKMDPHLTMDGKRAVAALYGSPSLRRPGAPAADGRVTGRGRAR